MTALQLALGPRDRHPLAGAHPNQVDLELGERGQNIEEQLPHRVVGVVDLTAERQRHPTLGKGVTDVSGIGNRLSKSVELRHDERVARAYRCQCLIEAGTFAFGAADRYTSTGMAQLAAMLARLGYHYGAVQLQGALPAGMGAFPEVLAMQEEMGTVAYATAYQAGAALDRPSAAELAHQLITQARTDHTHN